MLCIAHRSDLDAEDLKGFDAEEGLDSAQHRARGGARHGESGFDVEERASTQHGEGSQQFLILQLAS